MDHTLPHYELFAIRYATRQARRAEHFIGGDPHDGPMAMDYFVWVAVGPKSDQNSDPRTFVIDTGFTADTAARRKREFLRDPVAALKLVGVDGDAVTDVILTHLHYDHVGSFHRFPAARFHLQDKEMTYATGRSMRHHRLAHSFEVEDVAGMVRLNFAGRVAFHDGPAELAPGITLNPVGGHSAGLQFVRVHTRRGWVVVASDVTHFYENMLSGRPFTTAYHVGAMLEGFDALRAHGADVRTIIPGHDPLVMQCYPPPRGDLAGIVARLDVAPDEAPLRALMQRYGG